MSEQADRERLQVFLKPIFIRELEREAIKLGYVGVKGRLEGVARPALAARDLLEELLKERILKRRAKKKAKMAKRARG